MKAISAPWTGVDATDRAERGLGPFATLAVPIDARLPYLPKGAKGQGAVVNRRPAAQDGPIVFGESRTSLAEYLADCWGVPFQAAPGGLSTSLAGPSPPLRRNLDRHREYTSCYRARDAVSAPWHDFRDADRRPARCRFGLKPLMASTFRRRRKLGPIAATRSTS
jgi:hypothetical protein